MNQFSQKSYDHRILGKKIIIIIIIIIIIYFL